MNCNSFKSEISEIGLSSNANIALLSFEKELERAKEYLIGNMLMSLESTTNRMLRIAQSMIYFNKIKTIEETVKHIQTVSSKDIRDLSNEIFENGTLTRVILSSKNLLLQKVA